MTINFLAFSLYSLLFFKLSQSQDISTTQYNVINNVPNIPGGSRFDQEIGVPYTLDIMKTINQFIYETFEQPDPSDRRPVPLLTVYISDFPDAWGYTNGPNINISAPVIEHFPPGPEQARWNFKSLMYHEMTHIFQWFGTGTENGTAPGGLTEGVADYVKIKSGFYDPDATDKPGSGERWDEGYGVTAWFLIYCDGLKKGFTAELNNKMRYYYSDELFVHILGKSVDELWKDYKAQYNTNTNTSSENFSSDIGKRRSRRYEFLHA
ncbi:hypothetical protein ACJIZ3_015545 [Penstemon smallii]|uniref:Uncharacterized protein n=1 Tax=Penstemon smallii TaxID=265156 RepID=A0ABD3RMT9_9LAMI